MIQAFIDVWPLFQNAFLSGWTIALVLALLGIVVVARDQIFAGVAMSQASMLGIALAMWCGPIAAGTSLAALTSEGASALWAVTFSVGCALMASHAESRRGETQEAITGWVFLAAGSVSILLLAHSPHGVEEIHRLLASSLIGARERDVVVFAALAAVVIGCAVFGRQAITLFALDLPMAAAVGLPVRRMSFLFAVVLGVSVGMSIRVAGLLYTFGCLVLPALAAKHLCREVRHMFWVAPIVSVACAVCGFMVANDGDYPPAQMTVAMLAGAVALAWIARFARGRLAAQPAGSVK